MLGAISAPPAYSISGTGVQSAGKVNRFQLHLGNPLAETEMAAVAESQVLVGVGARNIETVRIKENRRVAVGGCVGT